MQSKKSLMLAAGFFTFVAPAVAAAQVTDDEDDDVDDYGADVDTPDVDVDPPDVDADVDADVDVDAPDVDVDTDDDRDENFMSRLGITLTAGGGVAGFTDPGARDVVTEGGLWEARVAFGTQDFLSFEAAYIGTAQSIDALGLDTDAVLIGTGVEGALRGNFLARGNVQPYVLAGVGWTRYSITNADVNTSDVADSDDLLTIPLGVGISTKFDQIVLDLRGVFRVATMEDMIPEAQTSNNERLDSWNAILQAGYEF